MKVNTRVRYGLRAILNIAEAYGQDPVSINVISRAEDISSKYLEQVISPLRRAELVVSQKGVKGGYSLARPPAEITLWDVIAALDNHPQLVDCVGHPEICERAPDCVTHRVWTLLDDRMKQFWRSFTLADLLAEYQHSGAGPVESLFRD